MKLAVICPPWHLTTLGSLRLGYHMALSQELMRSETYREWYFLAHRRGQFIIVDNGAAEGDVPPFVETVEIANSIGADEIAMPDVLGDMDATLVQTTSYVHLALVPAHKRMVIPQGSTWDEWETCLNLVANRISFATIGVPKHLESLPGGRAKALSIIRHHEMDQLYNVHLLGCYSRPKRETLSARREFPWIRGIDTGAAYAYAQHSQTVNADAHFSLQWTCNVDTRVFERNIDMMLDWCTPRTS